MIKIKRMIPGPALTWSRGKGIRLFPQEEDER
jgi:hypothetical protein